MVVNLSDVAEKLQGHIIRKIQFNGNCIIVDTESQQEQPCRLTAKFKAVPSINGNILAVNVGAEIEYKENVSDGPSSG